MYQISYIIYQISYIKYHISNIIYHISFTVHHTSYIILYISCHIPIFSRLIFLVGYIVFWWGTDCNNVTHGNSVIAVETPVSPVTSLESWHGELGLGKPMPSLVTAGLMIRWRSGNFFADLHNKTFFQKTFYRCASFCLVQKTYSQRKVLKTELETRHALHRLSAKECASGMAKTL